MAEEILLFASIFQNEPAIVPSLFSGTNLRFLSFLFSDTADGYLSQERLRFLRESWTNDDLLANHTDSTADPISRVTVHCVHVSREHEGNGDSPDERLYCVSYRGEDEIACDWDVRISDIGIFSEQNFGHCICARYKS